MSDDYIAKEKLYLSDKGKIVGAKDPSKRTLFMNPGGKLARAVAEAHGLIEPEVKAEEAKPEPAPARIPPKASAPKVAPRAAPKTPQPVGSASSSASEGEPQAGVDTAT